MLDKGFTSLTDVEYQGFYSDLNMADGHARQDLNPFYSEVFNNLSNIWQKSLDTPIVEMEQRFRNEYAAFITSEKLKKHPYFSVAPTASNSIDLIGAWLASQGKRVALIEPCFDNLPLLLKRRSVPLVAYSEDVLRDADKLELAYRRSPVEAIFIVNPNNPTGYYFEPDRLAEIVKFCERHSVALIVDVTFRMFIPETKDSLYEMLTDSKIDFFVVEDTGKTWPTQEQKASLVVYSESVANEFRFIYEEVFLCVSNFTLQLLVEIFSVTTKENLKQYLWQDVAIRRQLIRDAIDELPISIAPEAINSKLGVEWLDCSNSGLSDLEIVEHLRAFSLTVLPGRYFYWGNSSSFGSNRFRVALMKPLQTLSLGIHKLQKSFTGDWN